MDKRSEHDATARDDDRRDKDDDGLNSEEIFEGAEQLFEAPAEGEPVSDADAPAPPG